MAYWGCKKCADNREHYFDHEYVNHILLLLWKLANNVEESILQILRYEIDEACQTYC